MSEDYEQEIARLEQLNATLKESLQRCRDLINQWKSQVTTHANEVDSRVESDARSD